MFPTSAAADSSSGWYLVSKEFFTQLTLFQHIYLAEIFDIYVDIFCNRFMLHPGPVRAVTRSIKSMYQSSDQPITTWGDTPESVRRSWFNHFKVNSFLILLLFKLFKSYTCMHICIIILLCCFLLTDHLYMGSITREQGLPRVLEDLPEASPSHHIRYVAQSSKKQRELHS